MSKLGKLTDLRLFAKLLLAKHFRERYEAACIELTKSRNGYILEIVADKERVRLLNEGNLKRFLKNRDTKRNLVSFINLCLELAPFDGLKILSQLEKYAKPQAPAGRVIFFYQSGDTAVRDPQT